MSSDMTVTPVRAVMNALWPLLGGNHTEAELWNEIAEAVEKALADTQVEPVAAQDVAALVEENKRLQQALVDHNDRLRSAHSVAFRDGAETNWQTFRGAVTYTLAEHHETVVAARAALAKHERTPHE